MNEWVDMRTFNHEGSSELGFIVPRIAEHLGTQIRPLVRRSKAEVQVGTLTV